MQQEEEDVVEMETPTTDKRKKIGRSSNDEVERDVVLRYAWLDVSLDTAVDIDQIKGKF